MLDQAASAQEIHSLLAADYIMRDALGIIQHHDAVTGTAKQAVADGKITSGEMESAMQYLGAKGSQMSVANYAYAKCGARPALREDEGYKAADKVMAAVGMDLPISLTTAMDPEMQFWSNVDNTFHLTEVGMKKDLAIMITDPSNRMKVEAIMEGRAGYLEEESTKELKA